MKEIDKYIKSLYKRLNANDQEITDLKEETRIHLLDSIKDLESQGYTTTESTKIAIERFGDADQFGRELPKILMISRRRFSRMILLITVFALVLIISLSLVTVDSINKNKKLVQTELVVQEFMRELHEAQMNNRDYSRAFDKIFELTKINNSNNELFSNKLKVKYNKQSIDRILEMNKVFKYHNGVLMSIAVIAANTDYESPYFLDISELAVMKLTNSKAIIDLAEKVRIAKSDEDKENIQNEINNIKSEAELKSYQEALEYNKKLIKKQ